MTPLLTGVFASQISGRLNTFTLAGNYDALGTVTVPAGGLSSITFAGIPQTGYSHLQIRALVNDNRSGQYQDDMGIRYNGDSTAANYNSHRLYSGPGADYLTGISGGDAGFIGGNTNGSAFGVSIVDILDYTNTNKYKVSRSLGGTENNTNGAVALTSSLWQNTNAITSFVLFPFNGTLFLEYSQFALYGVKA
jgi:hypothetical protein